MDDDDQIRGGDYQDGNDDYAHQIRNTWERDEVFGSFKLFMTLRLILNVERHVLSNMQCDSSGW